MGQQVVAEEVVVPEVTEQEALQAEQPAEPELHYMEVTEQQAYQEVLMEAMETLMGAEVVGLLQIVVPIEMEAQEQPD